MTRPGLVRRTWQSAAAVAATAAVTLVFRYLLPHGFNLTSVGFLYLLVVLAAASGFGFFEALLAALVATAQYNFFFLPPVGSFTISDPQNWVALTTFLATATVASQLSAAARRRAGEAEARRREAAHLFELSRAILLIEPSDLAAGFEQALVRIFGFRDARLALAGAEPPAAGAFLLSWRLRVGQHPVGTLYAAGEPPSAETAEAMTNLAAIAVERVQLLSAASRMQALRESEALKTALLDSLTHDIRTPLTAIKAAVTALDAGSSAAAGRELLAVIEEEADQLDAVLEELLEMARIEARDVRAAPRPQALAPLVEAALAPLGLPPARLHWEPSPDLPRVVADGRMVARALAQLVANAAAYAPPDTAIWIEARAHAGEVRVEVGDHGPGIAPELLPRVFDKFVRGPRGQADRPAGLGMGLAIARGLILANQGRIGVDSQPGAGARFWFTLPAAPGEEGRIDAHPGD